MPTQPIKVLHVITWMDSGGAQIHVLDLLNADDAVVAEVASGSNGGDGGPMESEFAAAARLHRLRHLRREFSIRDLAAVREIRSVIRRAQPDIVHTHSSKAGVLGRIAAVGLQVRTVHNVHGWSFSPMTGVSRRIVILMERVLARTTDVLVTVSHVDAEIAHRNQIRPRRAVEVIRSGIELGAFRNAARDPTRSGDAVPVIGTVGRLAPQKDPMTALDVFVAVRGRFPQAQFRWIGDGPLRPVVEEQAAARGLGSSFEVSGHVSDVPAELSGLDVFVLCSRWEGLPRGLIEAMACRVPVVAMAVDGVPDVVVGGETGQLVSPGDVSGMVRAIVCSLANRTESDAMASTAAERLDEFSVEETRRRTAALYRSLV